MINALFIHLFIKFKTEFSYTTAITPPTETLPAIASTPILSLEFNQQDLRNEVCVNPCDQVTNSVDLYNPNGMIEFHEANYSNTKMSHALHEHTKSQYQDDTLQELNPEYDFVRQNVRRKSMGNIHSQNSGQSCSSQFYTSPAIVQPSTRYNCTPFSHENQAQQERVQRAVGDLAIFQPMHYTWNIFPQIIPPFNSEAVELVQANKNTDFPIQTCIDTEKAQTETTTLQNGATNNCILFDTRLNMNINTKTPFSVESQPYIQNKHTGTNIPVQMQTLAPMPGPRYEICPNFELNAVAPFSFQRINIREDIDVEFGGTSMSDALCLEGLPSALGGLPPSLHAGSSLLRSAVSWTGYERLHKTLSAEIQDFCTTVHCHASKRFAYQLEAIARVKNVVAVVWPRARVRIFGSFAVGMCLPSSDVDLVVCLPAVRSAEPSEDAGVLEGRNAIKETHQQNLARFLVAQDWVQSESLKTIENTAMPVITLVTRPLPARDINSPVKQVVFHPSVSDRSSPISSFDYSSNSTISQSVLMKPVFKESASNRICNEAQAKRLSAYESHSKLDNVSKLGLVDMIPSDHKSVPHAKTERHSIGASLEYHTKGEAVLQKPNHPNDSQYTKMEVIRRPRSAGDRVRRERNKANEEGTTKRSNLPCKSPTKSSTDTQCRDPISINTNFSESLKRKHLCHSQSFTQGPSDSTSFIQYSGLRAEKPTLEKIIVNQPLQDSGIPFDLSTAPSISPFESDKHDEGMEQSHVAGMVADIVTRERSQSHHTNSSTPIVSKDLSGNEVQNIIPLISTSLQECTHPQQSTADDEIRHYQNTDFCAAPQIPCDNKEFNCVKKENLSQKQMPSSHGDIVMMHPNAPLRSLSQSLPTKSSMEGTCTLNSIKLDITFQNSRHTGVATVALIQSLMEAFPPLTPLTLVLKQFLTDRGLSSPYTGGLSSYGLILMVTRYLQSENLNPTVVPIDLSTNHPPQITGSSLAFNTQSKVKSGKSGEQTGKAGRSAHAFLCSKDLGELLMGFLDFFGARFDPRTTGISILESGRFFEKSAEHQFDPLYVQDPLRPLNNVCKNCFRIAQIQRAFSDALLQITAHLHPARYVTDFALSNSLHTISSPQASYGNQLLSSFRFNSNLMRADSQLRDLREDTLRIETLLPSTQYKRRSTQGDSPELCVLSRIISWDKK